MFIIRIISFFALILISMIGMLMGLGRPELLLIPLVCVPLALYIVGYTSRFATGEIQLKKYREEVALRKAPTYKYREGFVGVVAIALGTSALYICYSSPDHPNLGTGVLGGAMFLLLGIGSLLGTIRGRISEPIPSKKVLHELAKDLKETGDVTELESAIRQSLIAQGATEEDFSRIEAEAKAKFNKMYKDELEALRDDSEQRKL